jgi:putative ABC transport system permease protein
LPGMGLQELSTTGNVFRAGYERKDKGYIYYINKFDENFIPAFDMEFAAGRNFDGGPAVNDQILINEEAMRLLEFRDAEEAIGSKVFFYDSEKTVIGVLKNFYHRSPKEKHLPMVFWYSNYAEYFSLKIETDQVQKTVGMVQQAWNIIYRDSPFEYFFLDETYNRQYKADQQFGHVIAIFCILAVIIACLGLFGLSAFTVLQRTKEIGIRKVLGASLVQIVRLLSANFINLVIIAALIALPVSYFLMDEWLSHYTVRINMHTWFFVVPVLTILFVSMVTVSFQTIKAAQANPVNTLKNE